MSRVAILKIGPGSFTQGFPITLQLREENGPTIAELEAHLPPNLEIESLYLIWQQSFRSLAILDRAPTTRDNTWEIEPNFVTHRSTREDVEVCRQFAQALEANMRAWLRSGQIESWQRIRERLGRELASYPQQTRLVIQAHSMQLWKLPWQTWDLLNDFPQVGIGYSLPEFDRYLRSDRPRLGAKSVRILAVLGESDQLDLRPDETAIAQLDKTDAIFLHQPMAQDLIRHLRDPSGWDIFFFAGHSRTEEQTGRIYINDRESLTVDQFRNALRESIRRGLQIAIFNSCDGLGFAQHLANLNIPVVICMQERVPDPVAQSFLQEFLLEYAAGQTLHTAVRRSQERLEEFQDLPGAPWLPMIYQNLAEVPPTWQVLRGLATHRPRSRLVQVGWRSVAVITVAVTGLVAGVRALGHLQTSELQAFDHLLRKQPQEPIDSRLLLIGADEEDLRRYGYPLPDAILAELLQKLRPASPAAIGVDIVRDQPQGQGYGALAAQFKGDHRLVAICSVGNNRENSIAPPPNLTEAQLGFVDLYSDEPQTNNQDATVRRYLLSRSSNPVPVPSRCPSNYSLALQLLDRYFNLSPHPIRVQGTQWQFGKTLVQRLTTDSGGYQNLDDRGNQSLIRYRHTSDPQQIARQLTVRDVLTDSHEFNSALVAQKIVLIGVVAPSVPDLHNTPYGRLRGLHIHAHMVSQILSAVENQRSLLFWLPNGGNLLWILCWSLGGSLLIRQYPLGLAQQSLALGSAVLLLYGGCWIALGQGLWLPLVPAVLALFLTSLLTRIRSRFHLTTLTIPPQV
jgi:CHASE2 domain-containing sensor protein